MGNNACKDIVIQSSYSLLIWLDANIREKNDSYSFEIINKLRRINTRIHPFNNDRQCIEFIKKMDSEKICLVVSGSIGQVIVSQIHDLDQIKTIVIFCVEKEKHEQWTKKWPKILGVFKDIDSICQMTSTRTENSSSNNQLDRSFMYTEILKDILISIDFNASYRETFFNDKNVKYHDRTAIDLYTSKNFLRPMLDRALKTMDIDSMIKLGFFIKDLHKQISDQCQNHLSNEIFTVYYGQNVCQNEFEEIQKNIGGLLSFNQFLLTTKNPKIAQQLPAEKNSIRILFEMIIDPSKTTTPFTSFKDEQILFSTHTVFRIGQMKSLDKIQRFFQVNLILTDARDKDLSVQGDQLREEISSQSNEWIRLGCFLIKLTKFDQAQQLFEELLLRNFNPIEKGSIYIQLGSIKKSTGKYSIALELYQKGLEIQQKNLSPDHPDLCISYNHLADLYDKMNDYSSALDFYEKTLAIYQRTLVSNHRNFVTIYKNIGSVYQHKGDYSRALEYYEKSLDIQQKLLPSNHPDLAISYNNIGQIYDQLANYSMAYSCYERAFHIGQQSFPLTHPSIHDYQMNMKNSKKNF